MLRQIRSSEAAVHLRVSADNRPLRHGDEFMGAATTSTSPADFSPLVVPGPVTRVPCTDDLYELATAIPDRRIVFRGVDWAFYEELVDSIPEWIHMHVDYDGKDLEVLSKGILHNRYMGHMGRVVDITAEVMEIPHSGCGQTTWKRPEISCGLESDESYYFLPEKLDRDAWALRRHSNNIADYPNPDLAIEVDISPPQVDRPGIYAALRVAEVWRFDGNQVLIERLTRGGRYAAVEASGFVPVRAEEVRHWVFDEKWYDDSSWGRRLRAYTMRKRRAARNVGPAVPARTASENVENATRNPNTEHQRLTTDN